jgi:hypothetical protein
MGNRRSRRPRRRRQIIASPKVAEAEPVALRLVMIAATNKCLAHSNKSHWWGKATNKREKAQE